MIAETTSGDVQRLSFISETIAAHRANSVLDIGCGTGQRVTGPLADSFPETSFTGVDVDATSIQFAAAHHGGRPNLNFLRTEDLAADRRFDLIIASEVIEHVEDPAEFLRFLRSHLDARGIVIMTLPNGHGPSETMALIEVLLNLLGIQAIIRSFKYALVGRPQRPASSDTLAISPHVNFFSHREIVGLFKEEGFALYRERNRTFLCGYIIDDLLRSPRLIALNASKADCLPRWCVSDWMFELAPVDPPRSSTWRRGPWGRARRWLNLKRWNLI
jgi:SAM-dependent methyltransferase